MSLADRVRTTLHEALERLAREGALGDNIEEAKALVAEATGWSVDRPKRPEHGDLATNIALFLTKRANRPPRAIAEALVKALAGDTVVRSAEIAGPGFVNLRVHPSALHAELDAILSAGPGYGRAPSASGERINLEFVSANPTGPINVASGRNAIYGDTVARLLEATGHRVTREYYINDFGNQIRVFSDSVTIVAAGGTLSEEHYQGEYVKELADWLKKEDPEVLAKGGDDLARVCVTWMLHGIEGSRVLPGIRRSLADIGIFFDVWFSEESLHRSGAVKAALGKLESGGYLEPKDGALFFVAGAKGSEDKDRVVRKSDGHYTYFASDIAYHADKVSRGYDRLITVLGADHHGYVPRVRNALEALGLPSDKYEALLYQLVFIFKDGKPLKSSKRAGNFVTLEEVADEIDEAAGRKGAGSDAIRFFFLSRSATTNVEFDIDLAKKKSLDNPVFYVQYGYARLCSIAKKAESMGLARPRHAVAVPERWEKLAHPDELAIAMRLGEFPAMVREAAAAREPHRVVFYLQELAREFQSYFTRLKTDPILPQESTRANAGWEAAWDFEKTAARLAWIEAIRVVYAAGLGLLGVGAPERMDAPRSDPGAEDDAAK
jgi:arginyl-tRNA synthetase